MNASAPQWDLFICHASEDKEAFVRPLAEALTLLGVHVWYDEFSLAIGSSINQSISKGIAESRYGLVIISKAFIGKPWPEFELGGLVSRYLGGDQGILPVWYEVDHNTVKDWNAPLSDIRAIQTAGMGAMDIALQVLCIVSPDIYAKHPRAELVKLASGEAIRELQDELTRLRDDLSEYECPICGSPLATRIDAPADPEEKHWDSREEFICGYTQFGGYVERPCPSDPAFPKLAEFEFQFDENSQEPHWKWRCFANPRTPMARRLNLGGQLGTTREDAEQRMIERYKQFAKPWGPRRS